MGDNIGLQINIPENGNYIEHQNIINDIEQIKLAISEWWETENEQVLFVLVVCENETHIDLIDGISSIRHYYGQNFNHWKPFEDETILELLDEYQSAAGFTIKRIICNGIEHNNDDFRVWFEDQCLPKIVVITDGLSISEISKSFSDSMDHRHKVGGFLIPLDDKINDSIKVFFREKYRNNYRNMWIRYNAHWHIPYPNIEIEVSKKEVFFKRLTTFATCLNIKSQSIGLGLRAMFIEKRGLDQMASDGGIK
jgi:hypothetical protein